MRRFICFAVVILMSLLSFVGSSYAAGTCTVTYPSTYSTSIQKVLVSCTADSSAATYPNATVIAKRGWIFLAETNPGSTAPTAAYDIVVNNTNDADVMSGALGDRSASATERAVPAKSGWVDGGALTVVTSNNSVNSATFTLTLWIWIQD